MNDEEINDEMPNDEMMNDKESTGTLSVDTFRPTEAQRAVMLNVDKLLATDKQVTEQDALNIPTEDMEKKGLETSNLEGAYEVLVKIKVFDVDEDGIISITPEGASVVEEVKKTAEEEPSDEMPGEEPGDDMDLGLEEPEGGEGGEEPDLGMEKEPPMESFNLIRQLHELAAEQEALERLKRKLP